MFYLFRIILTIIEIQFQCLNISVSMSEYSTLCCITILLSHQWHDRNIIINVGIKMSTLVWASNSRYHSGSDADLTSGWLVCFYLLSFCTLLSSSCFSKQRTRKKSEGKETVGVKPRKGKCLSLLLRLFPLSPPEAFSPLPAAGGGEEAQEVFDRCAGCETTPLYVSFLKGVSPGGVLFWRERTTARLNTHTFIRILFLWTECSQQTRSRKEGREGEWEAKGRWTLWGWKSCQTQTCTDEDRRDQTAMEVWQGTASGEFVFLKQIIYETSPKNIDSTLR